MKLSNLIWVLALAGAAAACNSGPPISGGPKPGSPGTGGGGGGMMEPGCDPALPVGTGACTTPENIAVYEDLVYIDEEGIRYTCNEATSAIGSDCVLGAPGATPPIQGCGAEAANVIFCFPNCPSETIADAAACVALCVQAATEQSTGTPLSDECVACTGTTVACGAAFCTDKCVSDPDAPECIDCRCESDCIEPFDECSGLPPTTTCG